MGIIKQEFFIPKVVGILIVKHAQLHSEAVPKQWARDTTRVKSVDPETEKPETLFKTKIPPDAALPGKKWSWKTFFNKISLNL